MSAGNEAGRIGEVTKRNAVLRKVTSIRVKRRRPPGRFARRASCRIGVVEIESCRRRRPEKSVLDKVVQENLATFLEVASLRSGCRFARDATPWTMRNAG